MLLSWSCSCWQESIARDRERLHQLVRDAEEQAKLKSTSVAGPPRDLEAWISSQAQQLQEQLEQVRKTAELEKNEDAEANAELRRQLDKLEALDGEADRTSVSKAGAPGDKNVVDAARARTALRQVRERAREQRAEWAAERLELRHKLAEARRSSSSARDATSAMARKLGLEEAAWASERASLEAELQVREHARIAHTSLTCLGELTSDTLSASLANDVRRRKRRLASTVNVWLRCSPR